MLGMNIGFPKSGTSSIHRAVKSAGLKSAHWKFNERPVGLLMYRSYLSGRDPFENLDGVKFISQADYCYPNRNQVYWPNLDFAVLRSIRQYHPDCKFILNYRDPARTVSSIARWSNLRDRLVAAAIPGLPEGFGEKDEELIQWIEGHFAAAKTFFEGDPNFRVIDIESDTAKDELAAFMDIPIKWWGVANKNKKKSGKGGAPDKEASAPAA